MNDLFAELPSDAIVSVNDAYYISRLPLYSNHQLNWVKVDSSQVEEMIVLTKLRMMGPMLLDTARNDAYEAAIKNTVCPGDVVLDAGTGTGLLAMMCTKHGASKVYACEMNETLAHVAERIVSDNGLNEIITVLPYRTDQVIISDGNNNKSDTNEQMIPEKADLIVCELMDSVLTTEGIIETLDDAKRRLGKPTAKVIPSRGTIYGRLVDLKGKLKDIWSVCTPEIIFNIEADPLLVQSSCSKVQDCLDYISADIILSELEFGCVDRDLNEMMKYHISIKCNKSGCARGLLVWWRVDLDDSKNNFILNGSGEDCSWQDHWHQSIYLMPKSGSVQRNVDDTVEITVTINPKTGRMSVFENDSTTEPTSKRSRADEENTTMKTAWMKSLWQPYLKEEFETLSKSQKNPFISLVDLSWSQFGKDLAGEVKDLKLMPTASSFNSLIVVNHADSGIKNSSEIDEATLMLFGCSKMVQPPMRTIPERALIKCAAIHLKQLEDPRPKLDQVKGFKHTEMFAKFSGRTWSFPLDLFNYEYDIACTDVVIVATMDFAKSELQISGANAEIECDKGTANAVVFWVEWSFSSGRSLELASPFDPYPIASCMTQFVQVEKNKKISISGDLDPTTNRLVFSCS